MDRSKSGRLSFVRVARAFLPVLAATPAFAQAVGDWRAVDSVQVPPSRTGFALAEMPSGDLLLFGGNESDPNATEWRWDGIDWTPYTAANVPRRDNTAMAKFGTRGLIVYGGTDGGTFLTDTWRSLDGLSWFQIVSGAQPGILTNVSLAHDPASDRVVMIGQNPQGQLRTWFYDLSTSWSPGPVVSALDARVATDTVRGEALLIESSFSNVVVSRLEGNSWATLSQTQQGLPLGEVAFDERRSRTVVMESFDSRDTVEWDGLNLSMTPPPSGQFVSPIATAMSYHASRGEVVFVADYGNGIETFRHAVDAAPASQPFGSACGNMPNLSLASGSSPQPGASHRIETDFLGSGLMLSALGVSHTSYAGQPLPLPVPIGSAGCSLLVEAAAVASLGSASQASQLVSIPNASILLGERYNAQFFVFDSSGVAGASNGLEIQIGRPLPEFQLVESFVSSSNRDARVSGDSWQLGVAMPSQLGGDGRMGSFFPELGVEVETGVFEIDTDSTTIPAAVTMTGTAYQVTDGRFYFTDFVVPAGVTVRFVGSAPAQVFVRGRVDVFGKVSVDAERMPGEIQNLGTSGGKYLSTFDARGTFSVIPGQPGGQGGAGGGTGGKGGDEGLDQGPIIINGVNVTNGQPGQDVRVSAGHAYAGAAVDNGGRGSELQPVTGLWAFPPPTIGTIYCAYFSAGGSGGGYSGAGAIPDTPTPQVSTQTIVFGNLAVGGNGFSVLPYPASPPPGYSSLEHFSVGGSGGGGGGSHGYGLLAVGAAPERWMAGHGGSGGGGVLALRAGGDLTVAGEVSSRGGDGALITGTLPNGGSAAGRIGTSSPGGGGSGGSILMQSGARANVPGFVNARGGQGARCGDLVTPGRRLDAKGGNGAPGYYRLESVQVPSFTGAGVPVATNANFGPLLDTDARSGSRSKWMLPASNGLPSYVRYELVVTIDGVPTLYSDDPTVSPLRADDPNGAVLLRFQGAKVDALTGSAIPGSEGPWRTAVAGGSDSLNADRAQTLRFDMVQNKAVGVIEVRDLRVIWR